MYIITQIMYPVTDHIIANEAMMIFVNTKVGIYVKNIFFFTQHYQNDTMSLVLLKDRTSLCQNVPCVEIQAK